MRDIFDCSIPHWRLAGECPKTDLWEKILGAFCFPPDSLALVKKFTMKQAAISLRRWRWELNTKYRLNGLTPYKEFGKIKPHQWEMFCEQKSSPEAIALSQHNSEQAKKHIHPHRLGPEGYGPNMEKWRKEIEDAKVVGVPQTIQDNFCKFLLSEVLVPSG